MEQHIFLPFLQEKEISKLPKVSQGSGPIAAALDTALQGIRVKRQAYHGKSFVGNHVHKCLKVIVITFSLFTLNSNHVRKMKNLITLT